MEKARNTAVRLLKQGRTGFRKLIFSRTGVATVVLLAQIILLLAGFFRFQEFQAQFFGVYLFLAVFMVLVLFNSREEPTFKLTWLVVMMVAPIAGSLFYLFTKSEAGHRILRRRLIDLQSRSRDALPQSEQVLQSLRGENPGAAALTHYVRCQGNFPVYSNTDVTYFSLGEEKFQAMCQALEEAREYIFLEYYIVDEGQMWGSILEILERKAAQGVDVRVMYDGTCEFYLLPRDYPQKLRALGIQCHPFSPVTPFLSTHYNYRDHRKILVIDGHTAFTGGVNLADEYINQRPRFGHWKDTAVMLRGAAAMSFAQMFLQMWSVSLPDGASDPGHSFQSLGDGVSARGFVMPFGTMPLGRERIGEQVYLDMLHRAERYVHIMTPYLILDHEMERALCYAALRGVEVQLILPGIPDKKGPYALAKTHFPRLIQAGVEIYLYDPGFVHAKSFVCDDREAVVGTINLDYRSLYHHFECAAWMYGVDAVAQIEEDFRNTRTCSTRVTEELLQRIPLRERLTGFVLKFLAPLL